jgi:hypothetical protein
MILPYHDIASAAALSQVSVCQSPPTAKAPGEDRPLFLTACSAASSVHKPSLLTRLVRSALRPISGPKLSLPNSGASNI